MVALAPATTTAAAAAAAAVACAYYAVQVCSVAQQRRRRQQEECTRRRLAGPSHEVRTYNSEVVDVCVQRLLETNDGGDACLDSVPAPGVSIRHFTPAETGFVPWARAQDATMDATKEEPRPPLLRGSAVWVVPSADADAVPPGPHTGRILYLHGGAYVHYSPADPCYISLVSRLSKMSGMAVLSIDYRLAPEHPWPAAVDDAAAALRWLIDHGADGHAPCTGPIFVAGDSAGGGLTAALVHRVIAANRHAEVRGTSGAATPLRIDGLGMLSPWTDLTASGPSVRDAAWDEKQRTGDPVFKSNDGGWMQAAGLRYCGAGNARHPEASPLFGESFHGFPPCLLQVSLELAFELRAAGAWTQRWSDHPPRVPPPCMHVCCIIARLAMQSCYARMRSALPGAAVVPALCAAGHVLPTTQPVQCCLSKRCISKRTLSLCTH
jgi:acetyl esterase/lipase